MRLLVGSALGTIFGSALIAVDTITIVSSLPRTGSANAQTTSMVNGIKMALDEYQRTLTVGGTNYSLTYEDWDDASPERGAWDRSCQRR